MRRALERDILPCLWTTQAVELCGFILVTLFTCPDEGNYTKSTKDLACAMDNLSPFLIYSQKFYNAITTFASGLEVFCLVSVCGFIKFSLERSRAFNIGQVQIWLCKNSLFEERNTYCLECLGKYILNPLFDQLQECVNDTTSFKTLCRRRF